MNEPRFFLKAKEERTILNGFPWVFDNEISHVKVFRENENTWQSTDFAGCGIKAGEAVDVFSKSGLHLGSGIFNPASKIAVRFFSKEKADYLRTHAKAIIEKKIVDAFNMRRIFFTNGKSFRLVFSEADFLPGFIADAFVSAEGEMTLVVEFLSRAVETFRSEIIEALEKIVSPDCIFERSENPMREKEGLDEKTGFIGKCGKTEIEIVENEIKFSVDIAGGQKTGFFLDQSGNRIAFEKYCRGKRVLDCFSHTGAFALHAFHAGAKKIIAVEISEAACEMTRKNIARNCAEEKITVVHEDAFSFLENAEKNHEIFDVVVLDPPAFAKSAKHVQKAFGAYKEINMKAMKILERGGILVSCSCSSFFDETKFYEMLEASACDVKRRVQVLEKRTAASDHPILLGHAKSNYLKCAIVRVL